LSVRRVTIDDVDVTAADIAKIPAGNLRVARDDFAALWTAAERHLEQQNRRKADDWYSAGVVMTCRWLATATVRPKAGPARPARSPVTERTARAYEELIAAEVVAAHKLALRRPVPSWLVKRPGWLDAVIATLDWAWSRTAGCPMDLGQRATG
jgi:hypothetical protein